MKSRVWILSLMITLTTSAAYAAFTEVGDTKTNYTTWEKVKVTVQVKVQEWMNYWQQPAAPAPNPQQAPTQIEKPMPTQGPTQAGTGTTVAAPTSAPAAPMPVAKPAPMPNEAANALQRQALFEQKADGSSLKDVQKARDAVKAAPVLAVAKPGRAGTSKLAKTKAGVPTMDFAKMKIAKKIPRLDIGTENTISRGDFKVSKLNWGLSKPSDLKRLPGPAPVGPKEVAKAMGKPVAKVLGPKGFMANLRTVGQPVSREAIDKIQYTVNLVPDYKAMPVKPIPEEHLKMVAALILFEKGNSCHIIMGMFHQLAKAEKTKSEATYHLGACADQLGMHQAAFDHLSRLVASEDKEFAKDALKLLAKDLPIVYEKDFYANYMKAKSPKALITDESRDDVTYRVAKGSYRKGDHKTSILYADQVSEASPYYDDARFLSAMNSFALGDKSGSLKKLQSLWEIIDSRKAPDNNIRALVSVNLARMYFAQKKYDKALEHYMQVPKDHTLWVQALIEQGWTQLALEDYSGAIGNMYSLHSPYFKAVYQPESFVVRTIGYLNICQYGDAYKTLSWLEKDYRDWFSSTDKYLTSHKDPAAIYNTVKAYIRGKSTESLEGVPYQVWREMARRKDFLNLQAALNDKQDEAKRYEGVNERIKTEKASIRNYSEQSKKRFDQWRTQLARGEKAMAREREEWKQSLQKEKELTMGYRFKLAILEQSRQGYLDFQKKSQSKLDTETVQLSAKAGQTLMKRAEGLRTEMNRVLENNEFLRYEVFAGSGENIRYQVAGGEVSGSVNRIPANIRPTKMMNWSFDGEFWEDEIGSYRSSLQNNCPTAQVSPGRQDGDHALNGN